MHKLKIYRFIKVKFIILIVLFTQVLTLSTSKIGAEAASEFVPKLIADKEVHLSVNNSNIKKSPQPLTPREIEEQQRIQEQAQRKKLEEENQKKIALEKTYVPPQGNDLSLQDKAQLIDKYLASKRSPLVGYGYKMAEFEKTYGIPAHLVVAIFGTESSFCNVNFRAFNCGGWMTHQTFVSYDDFLNNYYGYLSSYYYARGRTTVESIGVVYCVPPTSWIGHVYSFMSQMNF